MNYYRKYLRYTNSLLIQCCALFALNNKRNNDIIITRASKKSVTLDQSPRHNNPRAGQ